MTLAVLEPAPTHDLTALAAARAECGVSGTADDAALEALIRQASAACARYCNRGTFARELVRQTEHDCGPVILARDLAPAVVSVTAGGTALAADDWALEGPLLRRPWAACAAWSFAPPVVVEYRAGYDLPADLPGDVERACLTLIRAWWFARGRDPAVRSVSSEGIGMTAFLPSAGGAMPAEAAALLEPWRRLPGF